jgi:hypothetical protein
MPYGVLGATLSHASAMPDAIVMPNAIGTALTLTVGRTRTRATEAAAGA